jgi:hypothetical protein
MCIHMRAHTHIRTHTHTLTHTHTHSHTHTHTHTHNTHTHTQHTLTHTLPLTGIGMTNAVCMSVVELITNMTKNEAVINFVLVM